MQKLERKLAETIDRALFCSNSSNRHPIHYGQFDQRQRVLVTKSRREKHKSPDIYSLVNSEYTAVGETRGVGISEPTSFKNLTHTA